MKATYNWLKTYIEITHTPLELEQMFTIAGFEVIGYEEKDKDVIYEFEITPNRPDCLSVIGLAREIAALTGKPLSFPTIKTIPQSDKAPFSITIEDTAGCTLYSGALIEGVRVAPSPPELAARLESIGLRSINNVVDATNYVLMEMGQPLHAFDYATLTDRQIIVRSAQAQEKIRTIDEQEIFLTGTELLIADSRRAIALAGIMGGKETEVTDQTTAILLESAFFDPLRIRRGCRSAGLGSDSSYRFERRVDKEMVVPALDRAVALLCEYTGGSLVAKTVVQSEQKATTAKSITFTTKQAEKLLGITISDKQATTILRSLGCEVTDTSEQLMVQPPAFRADLNQPVDLIEELARIIGYDTIPMTLPRHAVSGELLMRPDHRMRRRIKTLLTGMGLDEVITYSLMNRSSYSGFGYSSDDLLFIRNPLSNQQESLRPTLFAGLMNSVSRNRTRHRGEVRLFEIGDCFVPEKTAVCEYPSLGIVMCGELFYDWQLGCRQLDLFDVKGVLEELVSALGMEVKALRYEPQTVPGFVNGTAAVVYYQGQRCGHFGQISEAVCRELDIEDAVFGAEIDLSFLLAKACITRQYTRLPKFPSAVRDIALVVDEAIPVGEVSRAIEQIIPGDMATVMLFDVYRGKQLGKGKKSLAFSICYRAEDRTLTDQEINELQQKLTGELAQKFHAEIRK